MFWYINEIYFTSSSGKEPIYNVWNQEALVKNLESTGRTCCLYHSGQASKISWPAVPPDASEWFWGCTQGVLTPCGEQLWAAVSNSSQVWATSSSSLKKADWSRHFPTGWNYSNGEFLRDLRVVRLKISAIWLPCSFNAWLAPYLRVTENSLIDFIISLHRLNLYLVFEGPLPGHLEG